MKKKVLTTLSIVLILGMAALGILAYLQSEDSDVNVMTLGNVSIEQMEYQRAEGVAHNATATDGSLVEFEQDKPLYPAVPKGDGAYTAEPTDIFNWGPYVTAAGAGNGLWNDEKLSNVLDKMVFVKNDGKSDAYYRTIIAFECPEGMEYSQGSDKEFMMNVNSNNRFDWEYPVDVEYVTVDGTRYLVMVATYSDVLVPGETSRPSLLQVVMTHNATNEDMELLGDTYEILVLSQAVQSEGFENAQTALDTAFGVVDGANAKVWLEKVWAEYKTEYVDTEAELRAAIENGETVIKLGSDFEISDTIAFSEDVLIEGNGKTISRADGFTGKMFIAGANKTLTLEDVIVDGGRNEGVTATGAIVEAQANSAIILNEGAVLQNNNGAHAVNLGTRIGATLEINGGEIINNSSDSGAIWGGGHITMNSGKINNNSSTGIGGAIRMVGQCNFTMNGGEICGNTAATDGGAIWGYGVNGNTSVYNFNGGKISGNTAGGVGGAIYFGTYSTINISGDFEMCDNEAPNSGAMRLTNYNSFNMTGGKISGNTSTDNSNYDCSYAWTAIVKITGGELADDIYIQGGHTPTVGGGEVTGVIHFDVSTVHNTVNLIKDFTGFKFTVAEGSNFAAFNFKPAAEYTYTEGDENKLVCMNEGYETYWTGSVFKIRAK